MKEGFWTNILILIASIMICTVSIMNFVFLSNLVSNKVVFEMNDIDYCVTPKGTGSMRPLIYNDTMMCVKKVTEDELSVGNIIIFRSGEKRIVHRISNITDGIYKTTGDYYGIEDKFNTTFEDIEGKVIFTIMK